MFVRRSVRDLGARCLIGPILIGLSLGVLLYGFPALAQSPQMDGKYLDTSVGP